MTGIAIIIWGVVALIALIPISILTGIAWQALVGIYHERRALRYLTQTMAHQERRLAQEAKHQADLERIQQALDLQRREADAKVLARRLAEETGAEAITLNRILSERDALQVQCDQLQNELRRAEEKVEIAQRTAEEAMAQVDAKTEEAYVLDKALASQRGEDLLTRSNT